MKTCPICDTALFDDMEVCYGCMYSFGSKPELERKARTAAGGTEVLASVPVEPAEPEPSVASVRARERVDAGSDGEPLPLALLTQAASSMPGWSVRFEMHDEAVPHRIWSMELTPPRATAAC